VLLGCWLQQLAVGGGGGTRVGVGVGRHMLALSGRGVARDRETNEREWPERVE
jgi:hypothetical protein